MIQLPTPSEKDGMLKLIYIGAFVLIEIVLVALLVVHLIKKRKSSGPKPPKVKTEKKKKKKKGEEDSAVTPQTKGEAELAEKIKSMS